MTEDRILLTNALEEQVSAWRRNAVGPKFALEHGRWQNPIPRPKGLRLGRAKACFRNAELAVFNKPLGQYFYVEGFAMCSSDSRSVLHHAWVSPGDNLDHAIEMTWRQPAVAYLGVVFKRKSLTDQHARYIGSRVMNMALLDEPGLDPSWIV